MATTTADVIELLREATSVFQSNDDVDAIHGAKKIFDDTKDAWKAQENDARDLIRGGLLEE